MAKLRMRAGSTNRTVYLFIQDNSVTTGDGLSGLTSGTSGLVARRIRTVVGTGAREASAAITLQAVTETGTYLAGGFVETSIPGLYRLDLPDTALAAGFSEVTIALYGAASMAPVLLEIQLDDTSDPTAIPEADASLEEKLNFVCAMARNRLTQSATTQTLYQDDGTTEVGTSATSDDGSTFERGEWS